MTLSILLLLIFLIPMMFCVGSVVDIIEAAMNMCCFQFVLDTGLGAEFNSFTDTCAIILALIVVR